MLLIGNFHIHFLESDYHVDNSGLPAHLQWISFVLECSLENTSSGLQNVQDFIK